MELKSKLLQDAQHRLRMLHKSIHTARQYLTWIKPISPFVTDMNPTKRNGFIQHNVDDAGMVKVEKIVIRC